MEEIEQTPIESSEEAVQTTQASVEPEVIEEVETPTEEPNVVPEASEDPTGFSPELVIQPGDTDIEVVNALGSDDDAPALYER